MLSLNPVSAVGWGVLVRRGSRTPKALRLRDPKSARLPVPQLSKGATFSGSTGRQPLGTAEQGRADTKGLRRAAAGLTPARGRVAAVRAHDGHVAAPARATSRAGPRAGRQLMRRPSPSHGRATIAARVSPPARVHAQASQGAMIANSSDWSQSEPNYNCSAGLGGRDNIACHSADELAPAAESTPVGVAQGQQARRVLPFFFVLHLAGLSEAQGSGQGRSPHGCAALPRREDTLRLCLRTWRSRPIGTAVSRRRGRAAYLVLGARAACRASQQDGGDPGISSGADRPRASRRGDTPMRTAKTPRARSSAVRRRKYR